MLRAVITAIAFIALPYTVDCGAHELSRYCKGTQVLTAREGVIIDHVPEAGSGIPMGRDWYLPNQRCFWSITPKGTAGAIRLSVNEYFRTESSFDYVDVYDRNPAEPNAALLAKFSGYYCSVTECVTPEYIVSYSGQMYISWVTDGQTENIGWSFSYATYDSAARVRMPRLSTCGSRQHTGDIQRSRWLLAGRHCHSDTHHTRPIVLAHSP
jgi:hypothetical protein